MSKHYFLAQASRFSAGERLDHLFAVGTKKSQKALCAHLAKRYGSDEAHVAVTKNGRTALAIALKTVLEPGSKVVMNGFTCHAVIEAITAAKMTPIFADINPETLHYDDKTLEKLLAKHPDIKGIIIQNTLGIPVDIAKFEKLAAKFNFQIFEDMAHCTGAHYKDGREIGTVGVATALSFGKEKSIDTVSGGAVIFRNPPKNTVKAPQKAPKLSDHLRARLYPSFGATCRSLTKIHLGGILMRTLLKLHFVEKSADNKLDLERKPSKFEATRALIQIKALSKTGEKPLREFCFVDDRKELLDRLKTAGYFFDSFWYEKPISPERYYKKVHFPEKSCPNAVYAAEHIINLPTYYKKKDLEPAKKIIANYLEDPR